MTAREIDLALVLRVKDFIVLFERRTTDALEVPKLAWYVAVFNINSSFFCSRTLYNPALHVMEPSSCRHAAYTYSKNL